MLVENPAFWFESIRRLADIKDPKLMELGSRKRLTSERQGLIKIKAFELCTFIDRQAGPQTSKWYFTGCDDLPNQIASRYYSYTLFHNEKWRSLEKNCLLSIDPREIKNIFYLGSLGHSEDCLRPTFEKVLQRGVPLKYLIHKDVLKRAQKTKNTAITDITECFATLYDVKTIEFDICDVCERVPQFNFNIT